MHKPNVKFTAPTLKENSKNIPGLEIHKNKFHTFSQIHNPMGTLLIGPIYAEAKHNANVIDSVLYETINPRLQSICSDNSLVNSQIIL